MAEARKCDVCGKFGFPDSFKELMLPVLNSMPVNGTGNYSPTRKIEADGARLSDVCSTCIEAFFNFFDSRKGTMGS
jgi:hypothetical protein